MMPDFELILLNTHSLYFGGGKPYHPSLVSKLEIRVSGNQTWVGCVESKRDISDSTSYTSL